MFILTSVLEPPFLMYRRPVPGQQQTLYGNARFEGYTADLAELIAKELNIKFEIRLVKDGQYGVSDPSVPGGWTGMIGELVRNEAKHKPLSDDKLAVLLDKQGIKVARRTIAKYREALGILPSHLRKEFVAVPPKAPKIRQPKASSVSEDAKP